MKAYFGAFKGLPVKHKGIVSQTHIKPSPGVNWMFKGESWYKSHFNPGLGLISVCETTPKSLGQILAMHFSFRRLFFSFLWQVKGLEGWVILKLHKSRGFKAIIHNFVEIISNIKCNPQLFHFLRKGLPCLLHWLIINKQWLILNKHDFVVLYVCTWSLTGLT